MKVKIEDFLLAMGEYCKEHDVSECCPENCKGIAPNTTDKNKRTYGARGNLRNGSNAGSAYVNCRNRLDRTNWNYLG